MTSIFFVLSVPSTYKPHVIFQKLPPPVFVSGRGGGRCQALHGLQEIQAPVLHIPFPSLPPTWPTLPSPSRPRSRTWQRPPHSGGARCRGGGGGQPPPDRSGAGVGGGQGGGRSAAVPHTARVTHSDSECSSIFVVSPPPQLDGNGFLAFWGCKMGQNVSKMGKNGS